MKTQFKFPFSNLSFEEWQNLAMLGVLVMYLIMIGRILILNQPLCQVEVVAGDYCAYWSGGKVANTFGYSKVYDLKLLSQYQATYASDNHATFAVLPLPYLPIFIVPFQLLSFLDVASGFWVWTLINLLAFVAYFRFFYKDITGSSMPIRLTILFVLSFQLFFNLYVGQLNIWLAIFSGEFVRLSLSGKNFRAGVWLGGLLLKPQLLIIIIPLIMIKRWKSVFVGFCFSSFFILLISFGLAGAEGFASFFSLLVGHAQNVTPTGTEIMMNWRMLGLNLSLLLNPVIGWLAALTGSLITIASIVYIWKIAVDTRPEIYALGLLATFAATGALTWHAHLSMALVLVAPILYLYARKQFSKQLLAGWIFMPALVWFIKYMGGALIALKIMPFGVNILINFLYGLCGLALNLVLLFWAMRKIRQPAFN